MVSFNALRRAHRGAVAVAVLVSISPLRRSGTLGLGSLASAQSSPAFLVARSMEDIRLGQVAVPASQVTSSSTSSAAVQAVRPILPGHHIIVPKRRVARLRDLQESELLDLWRTALSTDKHLERETQRTSSNWAVFDGPAAGQQLDTAHVHVVPRRPGDLEHNDQVYDDLETWRPDASGECMPLMQLQEHLPSEEDRRPRTPAEMAAEAGAYRAAFGTDGSLPAEQAFAKFRIEGSSLFYLSPTALSVAFVNLKPLVKGHVLVTPRRVVPRLADLTAEEYDDLFRAVRDVQEHLERFYGAEATRLGIQDGPDAGQSVPHVHVHVLPMPARAKAN